MNEYSCKNCGRVFKKKSVVTNGNPRCGPCLKLEYEAVKLRATPKWLSREQTQELDSLYDLAKEMRRFWPGATADHIVPLRGKEVCGLNVPWNINIIPNEDNGKKRNHYPHELCFEI